MLFDVLDVMEDLGLLIPESKRVGGRVHTYLRTELAVKFTRWIPRH